ncbi:MAG: DUF3800 domain-containing protein [Candidatus Micrarchaeota archaeon]|nr:DUF3800 domain-containing protein [Candidatus Micrarchaeota archaeon]
MFFLFADESGDINFKKGSKYFVYVGILSESRKACDKKLIELKKRYETTFHRKFAREIKASKMEKEEIIYFLDGLKSLNYEVFCAHIDTYDSKKQFNNINNGSKKRMQLLEIVITNAYSVNHAVNKIVIDKGLSQELRNSIRTRLSQKYKEVPKIEAKVSHNVAGIQIADLIAWAIRKHLAGDSIYYTYIENKIRGKTEL